MTILTVATMKGGAAKTTTVNALAHVFASRGKHVLMIDADPQGTLTNNTIGKDDDHVTLFDVLVEGFPIEKAVVPINEFMDIVPGNRNVARAELMLAPELDRAIRLKKRIVPVVDDYDIIFIDTPPSLSFMTVNALTTAHGLIIPSIPQPNDLDGLREFLISLDRVREQLGAAVQILGVVVTRYKSRVLQHKEAVTVLDSAPFPLFETRIPETIRVSEADGLQMSVTEYAPKSSAALAYNTLADEVQQWLNENEQ